MSITNDTFDFINQPIMPNNMATPTQINPQAVYQQQYPQPQPMMPQQPQYYTSAPVNDEPEITIGGFSFTTIKDDDTKPNKMSIKTDEPVPDVGLPKKPGRKKKNEVQTVNSTEIIRSSDGTDVINNPNMPTINTYFETATMIKGAIDQINMVAGEVKTELDSVIESRTMKSKYNVMVGLAGNLSDLLSAKVNAIKELNNCITKSNDLDYRKEKDRRDAAVGTANDEVAIMNLYKSIVQNPQMAQSIPTNQQFNTMPSGGGDLGIVRSGPNEGGSPAFDQGYADYMANITPQMSNILYEKNPDIKECVVFDASTGAKWFQVMNVKTGQVIPNADCHSQMFLEDTTLDIRNKIAKNTNLGETYPLVVINDHITAEY